MKFIYISIFILFTFQETVFADRPCAERRIPDQSVVCVCNSSYCDDITRENPESGSYIAYTSSQAGSRFLKTRGSWSITNDSTCCTTTLELQINKKYQKIQGFGGAVTDSAAINWNSLPSALRDSLINSYFSSEGLEYNMLRVPIGGTDFSTHAYAYNNLPKNDVHLTNYTLAPEDINFKIPMIQSLMKVATAPVHIVATTWSPPLWMKTKPTYGGRTLLKTEYYQTYADYHLKFIQKYHDYGIPIWGITTTNEPTDGLFGLASFNSLGWEIGDMATWIVNNLGPTVRNSTFKDTKIIGVDDQRLTIPLWFNLMVLRKPKVLDYLDGIGVHYYTDKFVSPAIFDVVTSTHPEKFILATEACEGSFPWQSQKVIPGSWTRGRSYAIDIIEDLNYNLVGWIDWNLCLDTKGGPNWAGNNVDSPVIVDKDKQEFFKNPMFYAVGHFSKFVSRGSQRIRLVEKHWFPPSHLHHVAFVTPRNTIVVIIYNDGKTKTIKLKNGKKQAQVNLEAHSITTLEFPNE